MRAFLTVVLLVAPPSGDWLGPPLRQDGYTVRPPAAFRMTRMDLYAGTQVGAVSPSADGERFLSAALVDGDGEDAASMLVAVVDSDFVPSAAARDELSTAVVKHFTESLNMPFALDHAKWQEGRVSRVEVLGHIRQGSQLRQLWVTAFEGEGRHTVVTFSVPSGKWDTLLPAMTASLDSYRAERGAKAAGAKGITWALAALIVSGLLVLVAAARARKASADNL
ncbi:MAG: hypothetical protein K1X64_10345 [Myxococcaceae bacterium]|nr:hypothetical protein [Myxococcaceae bacterium]